MPLRAHARSRSGFAAAGVQTNTRSIGAVGQLVDVGDRLDAEHLGAASRFVAQTPAARSPMARMLCSDDEPELARVARRAGDDHALRLEQGPELLVARRGTRRDGGRSVGRRARQLDEGVDGDRRAVDDDDQRVEVDAGHVAVARRPVGRGRRATAASASRSTAGSPRNSPSSVWVARSSIMSCGVDVGDRHQAEHDVGDRLGEDAADAEHHGRAELRVADQPGDELAVAR